MKTLQKVKADFKKEKEQSDSVIQQLKNTEDQHKV